jgi:23S rRNA (cytidine1920-2'-O)/16S rRNA (cytidine1409-2'-O)-methyltransferase
VGKGGVVRDPQVHADVLRSIGQSARELNCSPIDLIRSPVEGSAGNVEFLMWLRPGAHDPVQPIDNLIQTIVA